MYKHAGTDTHSAHTGVSVLSNSDDRCSDHSWINAYTHARVPLHAHTHTYIHVHTCAMACTQGWAPWAIVMTDIQAIVEYMLRHTHTHIYTHTYTHARTMTCTQRWAPWAMVCSCAGPTHTLYPSGNGIWAVRQPFSSRWADWMLFFVCVCESD